jgi:glutamate-1-semialdehyde 2,1-aminomutase
MHAKEESKKSLGKSLHERALRVLAPCIYGSPLGRSGSPIMPTGTPNFFSRANGARLWDVDGREYIDYLCALGPNLLGYANPRIEAAAERQRALGDTMTGPAPVMVELAERLIATVSHADWALFGKNGVDVTSVALRIARAQTRKRRVLVATGSYHGAHSWCIPIPTKGVLPEDRAHRTEYLYNDVASLEAAASDAGDDLAAIFATAFKHDLFTDQELPRPEYARRCRELCDKTGALLVVDDIRAGFRLARDCSWELVGVKPDLSCWSKAIANGYALSALLGSKNTREGATTLAGGTYWVQAVPMAASLATLEVIRETDYLEHTVALGRMLRSGFHERATAHGFELSQTGPVQMPMILFKHDSDFRFAMAFASEMILRGIYMIPHHNLFLCAAMTNDDITQTIDVANEVFADMAKRRSTIEPHPAMLKFIKSLT